MVVLIPVGMEICLIGAKMVPTSIRESTLDI